MLCSACRISHPANRLGLQPLRRQFREDDAAAGRRRDEIGVVADQRGNPTSALDIADGDPRRRCEILLESDDPELRGIFHMTGAGEASWAEFAEAIFDFSRGGGRTSRESSKRISTRDYPTPAKRPANSRLDSSEAGTKSMVSACPMAPIDRTRW